MKKLWPIIILLLVVVLVIILIFRGRNSNAPTTSDQSQPTAQVDTNGQATITNLQLEVLESFPVQVNAIVSGTIPDDCSRLGFTQAFAEDTFTISSRLTKNPAEACSGQVTNFQESIVLDVIGLTAGEYNVRAGSQLASFVLGIDNAIEFDVGEK